MKDYPPGPERCDSSRHLRSVDDTYVYDESSGLYKPKSREHEEQSEKKQRGGNKKAPLFVYVPRDWLIIAISTLTLLAVAIYAYYAALQWCQMKRATDLAQKANNDAWTLADRANKTAIDSERPWVGMTFTIQDWTVGRSPVAHVAFVNSGRRPAEVTDATFDVGDFKVFPKNPFRGRDYPAAHNVNSVGLILPNAHLSNTRGFDTLTQTRLNELGARQHTFFIYASVDYEDVLTHAKHWTHACWQYLPGFQNDQSGFVNCATYNDTDEMKPSAKP